MFRKHDFASTALAAGLLALAACGDGGARDGAARCAETDLGLSPLRRLTATQYDNTIRDLLGVQTWPAGSFSADERVGPFKSNVSAPVGELQADQYMAAAERLAEQAMARPQALLPCEPAEIGEDECARQFIANFGARAYRRPLLDAELERFQALYAAGKAGGDFSNGIRLVVQSALQSPHFLYHIELAADGGRLSDHRIAARLSYFLWDTMPDAALFAAADAGGLATEAGLSAQLARMLADPRARAGVASFHVQLLGVDQVEASEKSPEVYPSFTRELASAMREETATFASRVVLEGDARLATLLGADYTFSEDANLLALYGAALPADHAAGEPVPLPAGQRAGLLTQASVLTRHAHADQSSPVQRGKLLRENLMCQTLPPPPPNVDTTPPSPDPNATTRQRFEQHRAGASCAACHNLMDGLGFGFENFDGIGAWRSREGAQPVDASGWIAGSDFDADFEGVAELARRMAGSALVARCFATQWFRYALGRAEGPEDRATLDALDEAFQASGQNVKALIRRLVLSEAFRCKRMDAEAL